MQAAPDKETSQSRLAGWHRRAGIDGRARRCRLVDKPAGRLVGWLAPTSRLVDAGSSTCRPVDRRAGINEQVGLRVHSEGQLPTAWCQEAPHRSQRRGRGGSELVCVNPPPSGLSCRGFLPGFWYKGNIQAQPHLPQPKQKRSNQTQVTDVTGVKVTEFLGAKKAPQPQSLGSQIRKLWVQLWV